MTLSLRSGVTAGALAAAGDQPPGSPDLRALFSSRGGGGRRVTLLVPETDR